MENTRTMVWVTLHAGRNASGRDVFDRVVICRRHGWASAPVPAELKEQPELCPACLLDDTMARGRTRYVGVAGSVQSPEATSTQVDQP